MCDISNRDNPKIQKQRNDALFLLQLSGVNMIRFIYRHMRIFHKWINFPEIVHFL